MSAKRVITKEMIIEKALHIAKRQGIETINARLLAKELNCSTQPIYWSFKNMDEVKNEVFIEIKKLYHHYIEKELCSKKYPEYKSYGMGYISFAKAEPELFKLLFMRIRDEDEQNDEDDDFTNAVEIIKKSYGLDQQKAFMLHLQMWICVHGIATQIASKYLAWDEEMISSLLSDSFLALTKYYKGE